MHQSLLPALPPAFLVWGEETCKLGLVVLSFLFLGQQVVLKISVFGRNTSLKMWLRCEQRRTKKKKNVQFLTGNFLLCLEERGTCRVPFWFILTLNLETGRQVVYEHRKHSDFQHFPTFLWTYTEDSFLLECDFPSDYASEGQRWNPMKTRNRVGSCTSRSRDGAGFREAAVLCWQSVHVVGDTRYSRFIDVNHYI